jgi:hypothetical protein
MTSLKIQMSSQYGVAHKKLLLAYHADAAAHFLFAPCLAWNRGTQPWIAPATYEGQQLAQPGGHVIKYPAVKQLFAKGLSRVFDR